MKSSMNDSPHNSTAGSRYSVEWLLPWEQLVCTVELFCHNVSLAQDVPCSEGYHFVLCLEKDLCCLLGHFSASGSALVCCLCYFCWVVCRSKLLDLLCRLHGMPGDWTTVFPYSVHCCAMHSFPSTKNLGHRDDWYVLLYNSTMSLCEAERWVGDDSLVILSGGFLCCFTRGGLARFLLIFTGTFISMYLSMVLESVRRCWMKCFQKG